MDVTLIISDLLSEIFTNLTDALASMYILPLGVLILGLAIYGGYAYMVNKD